MPPDRYRTAELYAKMGMAVVDMPGGEIAPAAERGTIDCAEWVGGVEDLRLGLHTVWKFHYTPGMHESASVAEIAFNKEVWDSLPAQNQEAIKSAALRDLPALVGELSEAKRRRHRRDVEKHGVKLLTTPPEINLAFLKTWDESRPPRRRRTRSSRRFMSHSRPTPRKSCPPSASCSRPITCRPTTTGPQRTEPAAGFSRLRKGGPGRPSCYGPWLCADLDRSARVPSGSSYRTTLGSHRAICGNMSSRISTIT